MARAKRVHPEVVGGARAVPARSTLAWTADSWSSTMARSNPLRPGSGRAPCVSNDFGMRALVKLVTSWVKVPPVELDGSRSKRCIRDEAVKPNHKRDIVWNCRVVTKVNLI